MKEKVLRKVEDNREEMKETLMELIRIPALGPDNGGEGETKKAEFIMDTIEDFGFDSIERYDAKDDRVPSGVRPNIVAEKEGESDKDLVIVSHMDVVPEGDMDEWDTDPFDPIFKDGKIYGRGAEDNGQELVASIYAVKALSECDVTPHYNLKVIIVSDEETGSDYGVEHILDEGVVKEDALVIAPDHSEDEGKKIEIIEKSGLWTKIEVYGKQGHAAMPGSTVNANRIIARYQNLVDEELRHVFDEEDDLFSPPRSTFEPTKRLSNVPNVNSIPGKETQFFDSRILPSIELSRVKKVFKDAAEQIEDETKAEIELEYIKEKEAPPGTPEDSEVVECLRSAIEEITSFVPEVTGIGGGTVASHFRERGIPTAVWCSNKVLAHKPNEYALLDYIVRDCKVFAGMALKE